MEKRKDYYVDVLKGISCVIVIFLHCPLPGIIGDGIIYGLRFSVPIFFMVSGYYSYAKSDVWILQKAKYILKLLVFSELFYGVWTIIKKSVIQQEALSQVLSGVIENKNVLQIVFCGTWFNGTLWYLYAMFWTWILLYLMRRAKILSKCYIWIPILLGIQIFGRAYVQNAYDINKYVVWFRNALTFGLPFTLLGTWIAEKKTVIIEKMSNRQNIGVIAAGFAWIVVEFLVFGQYMDTQVSTVVISFGLFCYAIRQQAGSRQYLRGLACIGARWYTWIYLSHMFWVEVLR